MTVFIALFLMGFLASIASLFFKKSTSDGLDIKNFVRNPYLYLGGGLYVLSALLNFYLLKRLPYSVVVPMGSLTYVWTLVIAQRYLNETITKKKLMRIIFVLMGVAVLTIFK